jgi:hypothetical protein
VNPFCGFIPIVLSDGATGAGVEGFDRDLMTQEIFFA